MKAWEEAPHKSWDKALDLLTNYVSLAIAEAVCLVPTYQIAVYLLLKVESRGVCIATVCVSGLLCTTLTFSLVHAIIISSSLSSSCKRSW